MSDVDRDVLPGARRLERIREELARGERPYNMKTIIQFDEEPDA